MRNRTFIRVAMSANRDGYFSVIQEDDGEHWYGPWPNRTYAEVRGREIAIEGTSLESSSRQQIVRMRFNGG